jgi:AcrR family transcriptional regulator
MARREAVGAGARRKPRTAAAPDKPKAYHHGNLRRALLDGALRLLETKGVAGLTLRAAARAAGVSQAAPYRHFADKGALLAAVAEEGFRALTAATRAAMRAQSGDRVTGFRAHGLAYIRYAVEHPARFRLMFGRESSLHAGPASLRQAANETFALLVAGIAGGQKLGVIRAGDPTELALASWSMVHGLSALLVDGQLPVGEESLDAFASRVLRYLYIGLHGQPPAP